MGIIQDNHMIWKQFNIRSYSNTFPAIADLNEVNVHVLSGGWCTHFLSILLDYHYKYKYKYKYIP